MDMVFVSAAAAGVVGMDAIGCCCGCSGCCCPGNSTSLILVSVIWALQAAARTAWASAGMM